MPITTIVFTTKIRKRQHEKSKPYHLLNTKDGSTIRKETQKKLCYKENVLLQKGKDWACKSDVYLSSTTHNNIP